MVSKMTKDNLLPFGISWSLREYRKFDDEWLGKFHYVFSDSQLLKSNIVLLRDYWNVMQLQMIDKLVKRSLFKKFKVEKN